MKLRTYVALAAFAITTSNATAAEPKLTTEDDKILYSLGLMVAQNLSGFSLTEAEFALVTAGINDGMFGTPKVDLQTYGPKIQGFARNRATAAAAGEKVKATAFLAEQAKAKGAVKTASGLIITEMKAGTGESPTATNKVKVHYHGSLRDGTVFDSSVDRGEPASFPLNGVIKCWTEGVQLMKVGGKSKLICPSDIAYGDQGRPPTIPPGAPLVFEVELLEIVK